MKIRFTAHVSAPLGHPLAPTNLLHHRHHILVTKLLSSQHLIWPLLPHPPLPQPHPQHPYPAAATLPVGVVTTAIDQEAQRRKARSSSLKWPLSTSPRSCSHGGSNRLTLITPSGHIFTRHRSIEVACGPCHTNHVVPESMKPTSEFPDRPISEEPIESLFKLPCPVLPRLHGWARSLSGHLAI